MKTLGKAWTPISRLISLLQAPGVHGVPVEGNVLTTARNNQSQLRNRKDLQAILKQSVDIWPNSSVERCGNIHLAPSCRYFSNEGAVQTNHPTSNAY